MKKTLAALLTLLALSSAAPAWTATQNLGEYLDENLAKVERLNSADRAAIVSAVRTRFLNYAREPLTGEKLEAAKAALAVSAASCAGRPPVRIAEVAFAAYKAVARGADGASVDAVCRKACESGLAASPLGTLTNGLAQMKTGKVPPEIAEELVFVAMENNWPMKTFDQVKWGLVAGIKDGFAADKYARYVLVNVLKDPAFPGRVLSDAKTLFAKAQAEGVEPAVPEYAFRKAPAAPQAPKTEPVAQAPKAEPAPLPQAQAPAEPSAPTAAPEPKPLFVEDFHSGYQGLWEPSQAAGGNFEKFAKVEDGVFKVSVPEGNSWGKTGLVSKTPFLTVQDSTSAAALKVEFSFDEDATTGFVLALSPSKSADVWWNQNVWVHWAKQSLIAGAFALTNTQNKAEDYGSIATPGKAPATVTLLIQPGLLRLSTSQGTVKEGRFSWLKPGASAYLYIFSHPPVEGVPAALTLKTVKVFDGR